MGSTFERTARASGMAARQRLATLKLGSALAALAAASLPALAIAAEEDLPGDDQIVVTATRTPLQIEDAPATITVIDDEQIADDWLHLLLAHRAESPVESVGRVKELLMKWHYMCTPLDQH